MMCARSRPGAGSDGSAAGEFGALVEELGAGGGELGQGLVGCPAEHGGAVQVWKASRMPKWRSGAPMASLMAIRKIWRLTDLEGGWLRALIQAAAADKGERPDGRHSGSTGSGVLAAQQ